MMKRFVALENWSLAFKNQVGGLVIRYFVSEFQDHLDFE